MNSPDTGDAGASGSVPRRQSPGPIDVRSLIEFPFQLGFAVTGVTLTAAESAVNIARITADSVQHELNHALGISGDELSGARARWRYSVNWPISSVPIVLSAGSSPRADHSNAFSIPVASSTA